MVTGLLRQEQVRMKELDIIEQSVAHLESFVARTQMYSDRIVLKQQFCDIVQIFEDLKQELMLCRKANRFRYAPVIWIRFSVIPFIWQRCFAI